VILPSLQIKISIFRSDTIFKSSFNYPHMAKKSTAKSSKKAVKKPVGKPSSKKAAKSKSKPVAKKKVNKPAAKVKPVKKTAIKKVAKKPVAKPKKTQAPVKSVKASGKKITKPEVKKSAPKPEIKKPAVKASDIKAKSKVVAEVKNSKTAVVAAKSKQPVATPPAKAKVDPEEKFHNKAQRIIKELEETMDMDKVKPRIKVPVYATSRPKTVIQQKLPEPTNTNKEKYSLEFEFRSSKAILFSYLSDSSGMAGWFADEVRSSDNNFVFVWEGSEVHAKQIAVKDLQMVRYQWTDENDGTYFQFEIKEDDITSDIALIITDWANPGEKDTSRMLWENQVQQLRQLLGSL
jgi:hypothetical protein